MLSLAAVLHAGLSPAIAAPGYGDPLTLTTGTVYRVGTLQQLKDAVDSANGPRAPATILVSNGTYVLDIDSLHIMCTGLIFRSASGDRDAVIIRGPDEGPSASIGYIFQVDVPNVTIADISFGSCRYHGIQAHGESPYDVSGIRVHNCHIFNCNEQFFKGSSSDADPVGVTDGIIENCLFEFTSGWGYQYYTGGIDIHKGVNWIVRDNLFRNIRNFTPGSGIAEHAIHFWKRCPTQPQNVRVERNWIVNCDRGIGFGLTDTNGGFNGGASVIRNNFVHNDGTGTNTDVGIGLEYADNVRVDNNTVYIKTYWAPMEYRFAGSSNLVYRNNLVNRSIQQRDGAPPAAKSNNLESVQTSWFRNLAGGDLHLVYGVTSAVDHACSIADFSDDLDGESRPKLGGWDIGADEYDPETADSDGDGMPDKWETTYALNPLANDAAGDKDADGFNNLSEWIAGTDPTNSLDFFRITSMSGAADAVALLWRSLTDRWYSAVSATNLLTTFTNEPSFTNVRGTGGDMSFTNFPAPPGPKFYRIKVREK